MYLYIFVKHKLQLIDQGPATLLGNDFENVLIIKLLQLVIFRNIFIYEESNYLKD